MPRSEALGRTAAKHELVEGAFLFCTACFAVHRIVSADRAPVYFADGTSTPTDDAQKFLHDHLGHRLQVLRRSSDAEMMSHPRWDPMCRVAWEISDGESDFVVTGD